MGDPHHTLALLTRLAVRQPKEAARLGQAIRGRLEELAELMLDLITAVESETSVAKELLRLSGDTPDLVLAVEESRGGGETLLTFRLRVQSARLGLVDEEPYGPVHLPGDPLAHLSTVFKTMEGMESLGRRNRLEAENRLAGLALVLSEKLLPRLLRLRLAELAAQATGLGGRALTLHLVSNETWVPWELLRLGDEGWPDEARPYWVEAFALTRWLVGPRQVTELPLRRIALVVPRDSVLKHAPLEKLTLERFAGTGREVSEVPARSTSLLAAMDTGIFDGWHFSGHGLANSPNPDLWCLHLESGDQLHTYDLAGRARRLESRRPLVFLNACHSARGAYSLAGTGGLASAFLAAGAGAFVGTLWAVQDKRAMAFAVAFYEHFLSGLHLGEALRRSRSWFRKQYPGDPTWLAYAIFGHPLALVGNTHADQSEPASPSTLQQRAAVAIPELSPSLAERLFSTSGLRGWRSKKVFGQLAHQLLTAGPEELLGHTTALLRLLCAPLEEGEDLAILGRPLRDHLSFPNGPRPQLIVQLCHLEGQFTAVVEGSIDPCLERIREFEESPSPAAVYLLILNRHPGVGLARRELTAALARLEASGRVHRALLWSYEELLKRGFQALYELLLTRLQTADLSMLPIAHWSALTARPLTRVPLALSRLVVDQFHLREEVVDGARTADPAEHVLAADKAGITLLLGSFGCGKTTSLARALESGERRLLCVAGAGLTADVVGTRAFLARCVNLEALLAHLPQANRELYEQMTGVVVERAFKEPLTPVILLVDALDESAFLNRAGGLQHLFNTLAEVRVPVVLAIRTEFWDLRRKELSYAAEELRVAVGEPPSRHDSRRVRELAVIRLLAWTAEEIGVYLERAIELESDGERRGRLQELVQAVKQDSFAALYGDIPQRPLFLRFIAETVAARGLPSRRVGRAELLAEWVELKIERDVLAPKAGGSPGRAFLIHEGETVAEVIELAWRAMKTAAASMTTEEDGQLLLLPSCSYHQLRSALPALEHLPGPAQLFLHSLLEPAGSGAGGRLDVRFSHRVFQEYFLAWSLVESTKERHRLPLVLPEGVQEWIEDIETSQLR